MLDTSEMANVDEHTAAGFGDEWGRFDQSGASDDSAIEGRPLNYWCVVGLRR
jgi:hypothetical protein